jgi:integrase
VRRRPEQALQVWLEKEIPQAMRERLIAWGIIDSRRISSHRGKTLAAHVEDFRAALEIKGNSPHYVKRTADDLGRMFTACGFAAWADIDAQRLYAYLGGLRGGPDGIGQRMFNALLQTAKSFCKWMCHERRATLNPLDHLSYVKQTENRRERRALEVDEQRRLLAATARGPTRFNMTGPERAWVYRLALETGYRANEIRHLTPRDFDFEARTVSLAPAFTKDRRGACQELKRETAAEFRTFLADKPPDAPAFPVAARSAEMMQEDLEAAGIPYKVNGEQADFHSLRHTFITNLARAGVHPAVAMEMARHKDINLTMRYYTHTVRSTREDAVNALPDLTLAPKSLTAACLGQRPA